MFTAKEYRQRAWSALKPVLPIMLLIFLIADLPDLIWTVVAEVNKLNPPTEAIDAMSKSLAAQALVQKFIQEKLVYYALGSVLSFVLSVPLTLGMIGASQRILRNQAVYVRDVLAYVPHTLRAIWCDICVSFYAVWPLLAVSAAGLVLMLVVTEGAAARVLLVLYIVALIGVSIWCVPRLYSVIAAKFFQAENPNRPVFELIRESRRRMYGSRINFFLLSLSFIGWELLAVVVAALCGALTDSTLVNNVVRMLLLLAVNCYVLTAQAAFIDDLPQNTVPQEGESKMTE